MPRPKLSSSEEQIAALERLRTSLLAASLPGRGTIRALCDDFFLQLREMLDYEAAAVYLKTTHGSLDRVAMTARGQATDYRDLSYVDGAVALNALLSHKRPCDPGDAETWVRADWEYQQVIGGPFTTQKFALRGSSQQFGLVEVVCRKGDFESDIDETLISGEHCLAFATSALAGAITMYRSRNETMVLSALSRFLGDPELDGPNQVVREVFQKALGMVVDGLLDYRASVLRLLSPNGGLEVWAKAGDSGIDWNSWEDLVVYGGEALSGEVILQKDRVIAVSDIAAQRERFVNFPWIDKNNLKSCISCPLVARGQTLGTVTFYTGFPYVFSDLDEALLWSLSARFASYWDKCQVIAEKEKAEADLEEIRYDYQNRLLESARQAAVRSAETQSTGLLHESKGTYTSAILTLDDAREAAPAERLRLIEQCLMILKAGEQRLDAPRLIDFASANAVDVNAQIRSVVGQRSQWKRERQFGIDFELKLEPVPPIDMSEEDVLEIVENLLSNSIRSIRSAARKQGEILIITRVVTAGKENELEIVVQDNGTGIRRDLLDEIFEKGFTTYKGAGGTGLGLYLVRGIITSYRGKIRAESQYGSWTRFTIRLPI